jgi:prepilin-type N-terminal cleavage/methylation domain-containing protein
MKKLRGFTLIELLVVIAIIALLIGILVPALGAARKAANKMRNGTQLRGLAMGFAMWSDANSSTQDFPGAYTSNPPTGYPANATDTTVVGRFWALVAATGIDPMTTKMFIDPVMTGSTTVWSSSSVTITPGTTTASTAQFTSNNVTYALLSTTMGTEWHNNTNSGCPLIADMNTKTPTTGQGGTPPTSAWSTSGWTGNVAWGDVHTTFENSPVLSVTIYGNSSPSSNMWSSSANSSTAQMVDPGS